VSSSPVPACRRGKSRWEWTRLGHSWFGASYGSFRRVASCRHFAALARSTTKKTTRRSENSVRTTSLTEAEALGRAHLFARAQKRLRITMRSTATAERAFATWRPCQPRPVAQQSCGGCQVLTDARPSDAIERKRAAAYVMHAPQCHQERASDVGLQLAGAKEGSCAKRRCSFAIESVRTF